MRLFALGFAMLALAGCGGGGGGDAEGGDGGGGDTASATGGPLSVADAKEQGGTGVQVQGFIHVVNAPTLCTGIEQTSFPPACQPPMLTISNADAVADVAMEEAQGVRWSKAVVVTGDVSGDAINVTSVEPAK